MKETGTKLSELAEAIQVYPQKLVNIKVGDKVAIQQNPAVVSKIAEVEAQMAGDGRVLVRPSGTESLIRVMAEAPTTELVERYVEMIAAVVREQAMQ